MNEKVWDLEFVNEIKYVGTFRLRVTEETITDHLHHSV